MTHALYSYARISKDDPPGVERIPAQHAANRVEIARLGFECAGELHDDGISGELDERWRAGLRALLESWRRGDSGGVVVRDLDRLARHSDLHGYIFQAARQTGARIVSRLDDAGDRHARRAKAAAGEEYITRIRQLTTARFAERAREHLYPGGRVVFGVRWVRDCDDSEALRLRMRRQPIPYRWEIHPEEAARLVRAVEMVEAGRSVRSAAAAIGIRQLRLWSILRNPGIAGAHCYGRTMKIPDTPIRVKGLDPLIEWGAHPAIIEPARWWELQARLALPTRGSHSGRATVPLSGQLVCGVCGGRVEIYAAPCPRGQRYRYARCTAGRCVHAEVSRWPEPILARVAEHLASDDTADRISAALASSAPAPSPDSSRLERAERTVKDLASDGTLDAAEARRRLARIRAELAAAAAGARSQPARVVTPDEIRERLRRIVAALSEAPMEPVQARESLIAVVQHVRVKDQRSADLVLRWGAIIGLTPSGCTDSSWSADGVLAWTYA